MENNEFKGKNYSITFKNEEPERISIPVSRMVGCMKRFFLIWLAISVLLVLVVSAGTAVSSHQLSSAPVSLIGFNYDNAKKGLTPNGETLDVNTIKNPTVIEAALSQLGYSLSLVDSVRNAIIIDSVTPAEARDEMSVYKSAFEETGNLAAAQAMLNVDYFPVQYKVTFDFSKTSFSDDEAARVINTVLECYRSYFFEEYGYSDTVGNASLVVDYSDYDYLVAVDTYAGTLDALLEIVEPLKDSDFRSSKTGYSFSDLTSEINISSSYETDVITAYILENSVVKDKESMISYYEYRIDELNRKKSTASANLKTINASIDNYEKDSVIVYGGLDDIENSSYTAVSEKYDSLFTRKIKAQNEVSGYNQSIKECEARLASVKKLSGSSSGTKDVEYVEERIADLDETVRRLVDDVNTTLMEYRESVTFANAYSVLVPANVNSKSYVSMLLSNVTMPIVLAEAVVFVLYIGISIVYGFVLESRAKKSETNEEFANQTSN